MQLTEIKNHMDGVKAQIIEAVHEHAERRNYLNPNEEEKWLHIFVAYWQARNALLETIIENRPPITWRTEMIEKTKFFALYASMLILVDMARFILDTIDAVEPIRNKLNEGSAYFGIPKGAYNAIQQSLIETENLARIAWANWMFEKISETDTPAPELKEIIQQLKTRAELSSSQQVADYFKLKGAN
ncbi:hypothetical protein IPJ72_00675 [Candidatus Peregrinibacteria bacterium]|nr:MAG: hypothetical protein IPJ72_00675 [Candidatus Peregrinibacteria bacterium]